MRSRERISVVFPLPDEPQIAIFSPGCTVIEMLFKTDGDVALLEIIGSNKRSLVFVHRQEDLQVRSCQIRNPNGSIGRP